MTMATLWRMSAAVASSETLQGFRIIRQRLREPAGDSEARALSSRS